MAETGRWEGAMQACCSGSNTPSRVTASLCYSPSTGTLLTPSRNVIFYVGDRVEGTDNSEIERLSQPKNIASILVSKLGPSVNAWIIEPSHYKSSFACYENLLPSLTPSGEPEGYNPKGLPAARSTLSLLQNCLAQVSTRLSLESLPSQRERVAVGKQAESNRANGTFLNAHGFATTLLGNISPRSKKCPQTSVFGFSKGGVVLNQLLAELTHLEDLEGKVSIKKNWLNRSVSKSAKFEGSLRTLDGSDDKVKDVSNGAPLLPFTVEEFLRGIAEVHYVDVGLNRAGAYQTDAHVLEGLATAARAREGGLLVAFHGTPRQWCDSGRSWVVNEKDICIDRLQDAASRHGVAAKLRVAQTMYFPHRKASLQMHFEIIEAMIVSSS
ncbi:hypothetical protein M758_4G173100 [Ceratodon purpureus]|uniref:Uncharacterized protein n=1 Tax=Ceratodon purpureus TaxID=3225 RepID=A0A8T0I9Q3_CERPU|nr:hypothetical protein KC19_4G171500 [Ceratodon purpureus]KAG0619893.1 hypothetical protein M758_4G173100 [Ceratodon purpureus]